MQQMIMKDWFKDNYGNSISIYHKSTPEEVLHSFYHGDLDGISIVDMMVIPSKSKVGMFTILYLTDGKKFIVDIVESSKETGNVPYTTSSEILRKRFSWDKSLNTFDTLYEAKKYAMTKY